MSKESPCVSCDHICKDNPYNPDEECWGSLTKEQREALNNALVTPKKLEEHEKETTK